MGENRCLDCLTTVHKMKYFHELLMRKKHFWNSIGLAASFLFIVEKEKKEPNQIVVPALDVWQGASSC